MSDISGIVQTIAERRSYLYELLLQHIGLSLAAIVIITVIGVSTGITILYKPKFRLPDILIFPYGVISNPIN